MKVTIIGFWGGYPAPNQASSLYLVEKDGCKIALDFGSGALSKIQTYMSVSDLNAVILSHYHADHIADIGVLQHALLVQSYITGKSDSLPIFAHNEDVANFVKLEDDFTEAIPYNPERLLKVGPFSITFLKTKHSVPCYGMRITDGDTTFVYTADTAYQESWIDFVKGADMLLADCNFYAEQDGTAAGHMTSKEAAYIAEEAQVPHLILSHLPQYGEHNQLVREAQDVYSGDIELAYEGLTWKKQYKKGDKK